MSIIDNFKIWWNNPKYLFWYGKGYSPHTGSEHFEDSICNKPEKDYEVWYKDVYFWLDNKGFLVVSESISDEYASCILQEYYEDSVPHVYRGRKITKVNYVIDDVGNVNYID